MKLKLTTIAISTALFLTGCNSSSNDDSGKTLPEEINQAKNVILMISDGASDGTWDISSYWSHGQALNDTVPYSDIETRLAMTTFPLSHGQIDCDEEQAEVGYDATKAWDETIVDEQDGKYMRPFEGYSYINKGATDSAAAGTALATGNKTFGGGISVNYCGQPLETISQVAKSTGRMTGIVTSVQFNHATPAVFGANNISRSNYTEIGKSMLTEGMADLLMGTGHPEYDGNGILRDTPDYRYITQGDWNMLKNDAMYSQGSTIPWTLIDSKEQFEELANGRAPNDVLNGPLIGLAQNHSTLQQGRSGCEADALPFECEFLDNQPSLRTMTEGALNYLSQGEEGFFLMVEGGAVDWAAHANDTTRIIEEQIDFNRSVQAVADWVEENSSWEETLLIVTTDHGNAYVLGETSDQNAYAPVENPGKHQMPNVKYYSGDHTNELVRLYVHGAGEQLINDYIVGNDEHYAESYNHTGSNGDYVDNTHIFDLMKAVMTN